MAGVPPTFNPKPVDTKRPKPSPPKFLKHQVYEDASVFRRIDEHAIMVARYPHKNFRDLMWDLVYCANFTDLEKVRIIFRWMTAKNMYIIQFDQELPGTPEEVLTAFRRRKGTFAKILETMCIHAGLHCVTVNGFAKGVDYHPGKIFTGTAYNHSWNAVNVAGSWQLIDAHWATRYLSSEKNLPENLVYEYDDFYFLMEPQQAVYSHFPEDSSWQLLPRPVNLAQYEDLPLAKSQFFKCYLDFLENNHGVVRTKDGKLQMTLAFWRPCTFTFKLVFVDSFSEEYKGQDLKNYVLQETTGNRINFFLRAPTKGEFYLTIYAQHIPDKLTIETTFRAAAEYKIICDKAAEDSHPYPKCSDTNWGPGYPVSQFDLIPNTKEGVITAPNGHADVGFYKNDPKVNLLAKLKKPGMDDQTLDRCIKEQDRGNECNFSVDLPQRGEYGLEIYANKPEDGTTYTHMCQYMLAYPEKPQGDKQFKENYDLTPVTSAKPGSAHMIKPYGTYQPGTGSLAADAGMEKKSPTKKGKKGPATAPKPGQQHAYEEELPPPPPEFLQPMQDTEFQYVPRKDETTAYPSLAAQAATGQMRPGDERMGPYQGRRPAGGPGSPGVNEEAISPQYAGQQMRSAVSPGPYQGHFVLGGPDLAAPEGTFFKGKDANDPQGRFFKGSDPRQSYKGTDPQGQFFQGQDPRDPSYRASDPEGRFFKGGDPRQGSLKGNDPQGRFFRDSAPDGRFFKAGDPRQGSLKGNDPQGQFFEGQDPQGQFFDKNDPEGRFFKGGDPKQGSLKGNGPEGRFFKGSDPRQGPLGGNDPHGQFFDKNDPEGRFFKGGDPRQGSFKGTDPQGQFFDKNDPEGRFFKDGDPRQGSLKGNYNDPQGKFFKGDEPQRASLKAKYPHGQGSKGTDPSGQLYYGNEPELEFFEGNDPEGRFFKSGDPRQGSVKGNDPQIQFLKGGDPQRQSLKGGLGEQSAPGSYGQPGVGYGYPGDRGSGYGPGDQGKGGPGDRGSGYGPGYGPAGDHGKGGPGDRGSGYRSPGDRGSGYGSPYYGTDRGNEGPYPGYRGAPVESSDAYIEPNWTTTLNLELAPPEDFIPQKVESKTSSAQHGAPAPAPPPQGAEFQQQDVNEEKFKAVDQHAIEVSQMDHKNFRDLVWHLIYARSISDELEKARAIFLWLCTKDLNGVNFTNPDKDSPEEILMGLKTGKTTYAQIFETLCSYAGLHCVILTGFAKGAEYKPGMKFTGREGQHSWNAVLIHGVWRLVDCHWAARRLIGKHANVENVRYELDLYYFGPNSAQLIYTHFPDEQDWQLLKRPISQSEFEQLAPVKSAFFKYGLELKSHRQAVINCNGEVTLAITFPPHRTDLAFTFSVSTDDGQDVLKGVKLSQYGMQETQGNEAIFRLRFPESGSYKLLIYAKEVDLAHKDAVYGAVCEYRVDAHLPPGKVITAYPPCPQTTWGPAEAASRYAFQPLQQGSVLHSFDGSCDIKFTMPRGVTLRFMAKLKSNDHSDADLEKCVMYRSVNDQAVFNITFPSKGEYGLEVYANDPDKDGNTLYHVWQYLIISEAGGSTKGINLPPGYLGPQPKFAQLGLETTSHTDPYITTTQGVVTIDLRTSQPIRITTQLLYASDGANDDMSQYVLQQMHGEMLSFVCKLPKAGIYKLQIFALPYTDPSESLPGVFNFVIETSGHADQLPFPKQFAQWKEGCFLTSPQVGHLDKSLDRNGFVFFNLSVPKAGAVAVVVGEDWTQLDEKEGRWEGNVPFAEHWGNESKVSLCANYGSVQSSYSTLLEFSM